MIEYKRAGIGFVAIAGEGAGARWSAPRRATASSKTPASSAWCTCAAAIHGPCRASLGAHALGIRNVLCGANSPGSTAIASNLNRGLDLGGYPLGSQTSFLVGMMLHPSFAEPDETLRRVDFVITEPVFDLNVLDEFLKRIEPYQLPVIAGIRPLTSLADAEFLINERRTPVPRADLDDRGTAFGSRSARLSCQTEICI